jgi:hypothetical protein
MPRVETAIVSGQLIGFRRSAMARAHQPGQDAFKSILPENIDWKPFPAFPPSVLSPSLSAGRLSQAPT